ncbi:MAG TPA: peptide chain release factor N(5)-glutamine methyltransferase [Steroidobacteraceae bacterium]|nr:peptide chain release factor N(5)-glutamine methyltransferase [Steroidobacteraceae bacterium]
MAANLTVGSLLARGVQRLGDDLDAELLLAETLGVGRAQLKSHPERPAEDRAARRYFELIERRAAGEPVAYLLGRREFWSLTLRVTPAVLVPRPETELLVERALALGPVSHCRVADLGTGSGAIALALASERPRWSVMATDLSEAALEVAQANANALGLGRVEMRRGRWLEPLADLGFDLIVSNPPYIGIADPALQQVTLKHEPSMALTPGTDAMAALREIVRTAPAYLRRYGWLLLEHGADQASGVASELVARGFRHVRSHRDLAGHQRMTEAQWAP